MSIPFNAPIEPTKLIVIPDQHDLASRILELRQAQATRAERVAGVESPSTSQVNSIRKVALEDFARSIQKKKPTAPPPIQPWELDEPVLQRSGGEVLQHFTSLPQYFTTGESLDSEVTVLATLGAVIIDVDSLNLQEVQASHALVLQNFPVSLVDEIPSNEATAATTGITGTPWHLPQIHADVCHANGVTGAGVTIGILDTGIDDAHPEFAGKSILFQEFTIQGQKGTTTARDAGHHGTHVAGLIAGRNIGVAPAASLAVAAVLTEVGINGNYGYLAQVVAGMNWLAEMELNQQPAVYIVNGSFGASGYDNYYYQTLQNALLAPGSLLIAAIGNSGRFGVNQDGSPGNYDIVMGVGATDQNDNVSPFSDWGTRGSVSKPDLCAPGDNIWSSLPGGAYGSLSGTSMATPLVAGAAALVLHKYPSLAGNPTGLDAKLRTLVTGLSGSMNRVRGGLGRLDLTTL